MNQFQLATATALALGQAPDESQLANIAMAAEQLQALQKELRELEIVLWWIPEGHPLAKEFPDNTTGTTVLVQAPRYGDHRMVEAIVTSGYLMTANVTEKHGLTSITFGAKQATKTTPKKGKK